MRRNIFFQLLKKIGKAQRGAMAVITVICLGLLAGAIAIAVEIGGYMNMATQLQHAADASALAGASQLDNQAGAIARAQMAATGALVNNRQTFANDADPDGTSVVIENSDIVFYSSLDPNIAVDIASPDADDLANFIEVNVSPRTVNYAFAALVKDDPSASAGARAVAGLGEAICNVPPMMMCNPAETTTSTDFDPGSLKGQGIILKSAGANSAWAPGNFGLLALDNHNLSTNDLRDAMGKINPTEICFSTDGSIGSKPGEAAAVAQGFNVRFDIYEGATKDLATETQYAPSPNAVKGMIKAGPACSYNPNGGNGWTKPANPYDGPEDPDTPIADAMGFPRDDCAYSPLSNGDGDCTVDSSTRIGSGNWDIDSYTAVNHGVVDWMTELSTDTPTRYEVYQWELNIPQIVNNGTEDASPQCNIQIPDTGPDRRVISIAVVNCIASDVKGQTPDLDVELWIDIFITEPMGSDGGNNYLYGEIIGATIGGELKETVVKYVSQLYE